MTIWSYSDNQGANDFGQMTSEETTNAEIPGFGSELKIPETKLTRSYAFDTLGRVDIVTTVIYEKDARPSRALFILLFFLSCLPFTLTYAAG